MKTLITVLIALWTFAPHLLADVKLPAIFSDHMVLQAGSAVPVWGWADPSEEISVAVAGQTKTTKADATGKWMVKLDKLKTGDAITLMVKGKNSITVNDVLIGEVWLCSGQSNMAMTVNRAKNFEQEQPAAKFPKIRMFKESSGAALTPQDKCSGEWQACSPDTVGSFSATAYFFGREVHKTLGAPVGLINSSVGGTPVEAWMSWDVQKNFAEMKPVFESWDQRQTTWDPVKAKAAYEKQLAAWKESVKKAKAANKPAPRGVRPPAEPRLDSKHPAVLFNGKIAPLIPYAIRGAIWYQGESNAGGGTGHLYQLLLSTMIKEWRTRWGEGDFPFGWVQLPNFHAAQKEPVEDTGWVMVREGMLKTLALPNTGMAITTDIGEAGNIHPTNKQEAGKRLAMWALADVYKQKDVASCGPLAVSHKIKGSEVTITFKHADGGLVVNSGGAMVTPREEWPSVWPEGGFGTIRGFAVAGADKQWHPAFAKIIGNTVVVKSPEVKQPVAVRYAWADNPDCNLYNRVGLPASPFRTDDWPVNLPEPVQRTRR